MGPIDLEKWRDKLLRILNAKLEQIPTDLLTIIGDYASPINMFIWQIHTAFANLWPLLGPYVLDSELSESPFPTPNMQAAKQGIREYDADWHGFNDVEKFIKILRKRKNKVNVQTYSNSINDLISVPFSFEDAKVVYVGSHHRYEISNLLSDFPVGDELEEVYDVSQLCQCIDDVHTDIRKICEEWTAIRTRIIMSSVRIRNIRIDETQSPRLICYIDFFERHEAANEDEYDDDDG